MLTKDLSLRLVLDLVRHGLRIGYEEWTTNGYTAYWRLDGCGAAMRFRTIDQVQQWFDAWY